jgi:8-oxo-dGTP diphosphatase
MPVSRALDRANTTLAGEFRRVVDMADSSDHARFAVTVDLVVLTIRADRLCALVACRPVQPYAGLPALPGGFVRVDETLHSAARRELAALRAVDADEVHLEQLASYGEPGRDPRSPTVSVAWLAVAPHAVQPATGGDDAARWVPVDELLRGRLALDHRRILQDGVERAQAKLEYSTIGTAFCGEEFTIADLRHVYEVVWGRRLDPGNFHRKVTGAEGFVVETGEHVTRRGGRRAQLYRRGRAELLHPPLTRTSFHPWGTGGFGGRSGSGAGIAGPTSG